MNRGRITVVALIAAFNEEDVIDQVLDDLHRQGVDVYFLDDGSTDRTRAIAEARLGRGVIAVESLSPPDGEPAAGPEFRWADILRRKEELATAIDADWFIHHDADEFRQSPWPDLPLAEAIARVDRAGFNAIDFALLDFWPTDETFIPGTDVRESIQNFEEGRNWNALQVKCWKKGGARVDLASSGGHDVQFPGRRVYPLRFILRHYPIRSTEHGQRKVSSERRPRFREQERERGWHVQYASIRPGEPLIRNATTLRRYDAAVVRAQISTADVERVDAARQQLASECTTLRYAAAAAQASEHAALLRETDARQREGEARNREAAAQQFAAEAHRIAAEAQQFAVAQQQRASEAQQQAAAAGREEAIATERATGQNRRASALTEALADRERQLQAYQGEQRRLLAEIQAIYASRAWRATRPFRAIFEWFVRKRA